MTRKRFIKLLTGRYGITRNGANAMAQHVRRRGGTYRHALAYFEIEVYRKIRDAFMRGDSKSDPVGMCNYIMPYQGLLSEIRQQEPYAYRPMFLMGSTLLHPLPVVTITKTDDQPAAGGGTE